MKIKTKASIKKRKTSKGISYQAQIRNNDGHHPQSKNFPTLQEARDWARDEETRRRQINYSSSFLISRGLNSLLSTLITLSPNLLFEGILVDSLDNLFKTVSPSICQQKKPILPSAFLSFPHLWIGHRIPQPLLHSKRQGFALSQQLHYECLLRSLKLPTQCFYQCFLDRKNP